MDTHRQPPSPTPLQSPPPPPTPAKLMLPKAGILRHISIGRPLLATVGGRRASASEVADVSATDHFDADPPPIGYATVSPLLPSVKWALADTTTVDNCCRPLSLAADADAGHDVRYIDDNDDLSPVDQKQWLPHRFQHSQTRKQRSGFHGLIGGGIAPTVRNVPDATFALSIATCDFTPFKRSAVYSPYPKAKATADDTDTNHSDDEDYSLSVSAVMQRRASRKGGYKGARRSSSPRCHGPMLLTTVSGGIAGPTAATSAATTSATMATAGPVAATTAAAAGTTATNRRRSSVFTTSSGEAVLSYGEGGGTHTRNDSTKEQIFENIRLHKEVLQSVKLQPWSMRRKLRLVRQAKEYVARHEGALQERFAVSRSTRDLWARFKIMLASRWQHTKREVANVSTVLIPWELRIKEIESHFGSVVASYFTFLRWLLWVNIVIALALMVFVVAPEFLATQWPPQKEDLRKNMLPAEKENATRLISIWDFEGFLKYSPIFYGYYSDFSGAVRWHYDLPLAYFLTGLLVYIYSFWATLRKMAENSRTSKLTSKDDECVFSWKLFTGWDYMIGHQETAHNRIASVVLGFKEALLEEAEKKKDKRNWKIIVLRVIVNLLVLHLLAVSAFAVVSVVNRSTEKGANDSYWRRNEITVVITAITFFFPMFFEALGFLECYHPRKQLRMQLARIMALNLLNLYALIIALFDKIGSMNKRLVCLRDNITQSRDLMEGQWLLPATTTTGLPTMMWDNLTDILTSTSEFDASPITDGVAQTTHSNMETSTVSSTALLTSSSLTELLDYATTASSSIFDDTSTMLMSTIETVSAECIRTLVNCTARPTDVLPFFANQTSSALAMAIVTALIGSSVSPSMTPTTMDSFSNTSNNSNITSDQFEWAFNNVSTMSDWTTDSHDTTEPNLVTTLEDYADEYDDSDDYSDSAVEPSYNRQIRQVIEMLNSINETDIIFNGTEFIGLDMRANLTDWLGRLSERNISDVSISNETDIVQFVTDLLDGVFSFGSDVVEQDFDDDEECYIMVCNNYTTADELDDTTEDAATTHGITLPFTEVDDTVPPVFSTPSLVDDPTTTPTIANVVTGTLAEHSELASIGQTTDDNVYTFEYSTPDTISSSTAINDQYAAFDPNAVFADGTLHYSHEHVSLTRFIMHMDADEQLVLRKLCWETMFGQELVKLTVMDLVATIASTLFMDFFRALFVRFFNKFWCWDLEKRYPKYGDFKIAENILHLVNNQGQVWMGMFFSPGLAILNLLKLVIIMYLRSWAVLTCNVPHEVVFRASRSNNFYLALLLTMLFLCVLPVGYAIVWINPSWHCGPFSKYKRIYHIFTHTLRATLPKQLHGPLDYIASPSTVIPLLLLLILIIYYLMSLTGALRAANQDLRVQLRRERTEGRKKMLRLPKQDDDLNGQACNVMDRWRKVLEASASPVSPTGPSNGLMAIGAGGMQATEVDEMKINTRKELLARIMKKALRKGSNTSEDDSQHGISGIGDDETDTEQHDSLPHDMDTTARPTVPLKRPNSLKKSHRRAPPINPTSLNPNSATATEDRRSTRNDKSTAKPSIRDVVAQNRVTRKPSSPSRFKVERVDECDTPTTDGPEQSPDDIGPSRVVHERRRSLLRQRNLCDNTAGDLLDPNNGCSFEVINEKPVQKLPVKRLQTSRAAKADTTKKPAEPDVFVFDRRSAAPAAPAANDLNDLSDDDNTSYRDIMIAPDPADNSVSNLAIRSISSNDTSWNNDESTAAGSLLSPAQARRDSSPDYAVIMRRSSKRDGSSLSGSAAQSPETPPPLPPLPSVGQRSEKTSAESPPIVSAAALPSAKPTKRRFNTFLALVREVVTVRKQESLSEENPPSPSTPSDELASGHDVDPLPSPSLPLARRRDSNTMRHSLRRKSCVPSQTSTNRQDSQTSMWSDNIPVITISKTESDECILEDRPAASDERRKRTEMPTSEERDNLDVQSD